MKDAFLDMDGVIVNTAQGCCEIFGIDNPYLKGVGLGNWAIEDVVKREIFKYLTDDDWANLPKMPDADEIVDLLLSHYDKVTILSNPCSTSEPEAAMPGKYRWLNQHYPQFCRSFLFGPDKTSCARSGVLFDDSDDNIIQFYTAGGVVCLIPRPWNSGHSNPKTAVQVIREFLA